MHKNLKITKQKLGIKNIEEGKKKKNGGKTY